MSKRELPSNTPGLVAFAENKEAAKERALAAAEEASLKLSAKVSLEDLFNASADSSVAAIASSSSAVIQDGNKGKTSKGKYKLAKTFAIESDIAGRAAVEAAALSGLPPAIRSMAPIVRLPPNDRERIIQNLRDTFKMTYSSFEPSLLEEEKRVEVVDLSINFIEASVGTTRLFSSNNTNDGSASLVTQLAKKTSYVEQTDQAVFDRQCETVKIFDRSLLNTFINWSDEELRIPYKSASASSSSESDAPEEPTGGPGEARLAYRLGSNVNGDSFSYDMVMKLSGDEAPKCHKVEVKQLDFPSASFLTGIKVKKYAELNFFNRINPLITKLGDLYSDAKRKKFNLLHNMDVILIRVLSLIEKCFIEGLNEAAEGFFLLMNFVFMFLHNIKKQLLRFTFTIEGTPIYLLACYEMYLPLKNRVQNTPNFDEIIGITGSEQIALLLYYLDHEFIDEPASLYTVLNNLLTPFVHENIKLALVNEKGFMILDNVKDKQHAFVVFSRLTRGAIRFKVLGEAYIKMSTSSNEIPLVQPVINDMNQNELLASILGRIGILDNIDKIINEPLIIEQLGFIKEIETALAAIELCKNEIAKKNREDKAKKASASSKETVQTTNGKGKVKKPVVSEASASEASASEASASEASASKTSTKKPKGKNPVVSSIVANAVAASKSKGDNSLGVKIYNRYKLYFRSKWF